MRSVVRSLVACLASFAVVVTATGWLYLLRPLASLPGPTVHDALPLDELSGHAKAPLGISQYAQ